MPRAPRLSSIERHNMTTLQGAVVLVTGANGGLATDTTIVLNNAGALAPSSMLDADLDEVRALFETNVFGPLAVAQAFAPVLTANGGGALVDIHSALSWYAAGNAYSATKAAFWSVTNSLRLELAPRGTQVVGVHLGYTDTPMIADLDVPKGRPDDIVRRVYDGLEAGGPGGAAAGTPPGGEGTVV